MTYYRCDFCNRFHLASKLGHDSLDLQHHPDMDDAQSGGGSTPAETDLAAWQP